MSTSNSASDIFSIEHLGEVTLITATPALEKIADSLEEEVAALILGPIRSQKNPLVVFDLSEVTYFGSMFISLLLRCWKLTSVRGGEMVLAGVSQHAKELLRITSLDMVWAMYDSRSDALEALLSN